MVNKFYNIFKYIESDFKDHVISKYLKIKIFN